MVWVIACGLLRYPIWSTAFSLVQFITYHGQASLSFLPPNAGGRRAHDSGGSLESGEE